ncbi:ATP-binding protein [Halorientalis pallida]|uniref:ATP-binding protein n=1 Tax=Halorientalis pallida TaxID=2479928 RepID=A0A498KSV7_9EURY|nr:ATP-binding protein [Halorientalis pallida]RXK47010.1 ATP-binding protein [Halorientalis pallida]
MPFDSPAHTTIEVLLYTHGHGEITYLFGGSDPEKLDALEGLLREAVPNSYEFQRVEFHPDALADPDHGSIAGLEFEGQPRSPRDWQTRLTPYTDFYGPENRYRKDKSNSTHEGQTKTIPLATIAETMARSDIRVLYQALLTPYDDFTNELDAYSRAIETGSVGILDQAINALAGYPDPEDIRLTATDQTRLEALVEKDGRHSFIMNARTVAMSEEESESENLIRTLESAFAEVSGTTYDIRASVSTGDYGQTLFEQITDRTIQHPTYETLTQRLPGTQTGSTGIVADPAEVGSFCLLDGDALTSEGSRAVAPTSAAKTGLRLPPQSVLGNYQQPGFKIGLPLTADKTPRNSPVAVPPALQPMHQAILGATGSGKSVLNLSGVLSNHATTDGPSVLFLPKGGNAVAEYLLAHHARFDGLDDVVYFDCSETVPALSFFDIRPQLEAGIPRTTAVQDVADHYIELLGQIMGMERFERAVRSPDLIRYLIHALFDPVHGSDAFSHRELHLAVKKMQQDGSPPAVSDAELERSLSKQLDTDARTFSKIMAGVASRIEKITIDARLARMFNHVAVDEPTGDDDATHDEDGAAEDTPQTPHFDLGEYLDENVVIIVDTGGIRTAAQRAIALAILSNAWSALKRRTRSSGPETDHALVNLYIEEAASIANASLLKELLAQGREFDVSVTLAMQFPSQLAGADASAADELLNNVQSVVSGSVPSDFELAKRLATGETDAQTIADRLDGLRRGEWLVKLPGEFLGETPEPFLVQSLPLPPGHPKGSMPLAGETRSGFESARDDLEARTIETVGLELTEPQTAEDASQVTDETDEETVPVRVDSALPHTKRLPGMVSYEEGGHALLCADCETRYSPDDAGLEQAIECCHSRSEVDPDDIPITDVNLRLDENERRQSEWSDQALMFLQAVHNASQFTYEAPGYDLLSDSMIRLQEYVGVESAEVDELLEAGLLSQDTTRPHRLYSLRPEGRKLIGQENQHGVHYGHGKGDLDESTQHVLGVEVTRQWVEQEFREDSESPVVEVRPYYELREGSVPVAGFMGSDTDAAEASSDFEQHRLDLAGLDVDGEIVVVCEIERVNHDLRRAAPSDYDKMAACDPEEAIWVAMSHSEAHEILQALNDPLEGDQRVEKTYSESSPVQKFRIDEPGFTQMHTLEQLLSKVREE